MVQSMVNNGIKKEIIIETARPMFVVVADGDGREFERWDVEDFDVDVGGVLEVDESSLDGLTPEQDETPNHTRQPHYAGLWSISLW